MAVYEVVLVIVFVLTIYKLKSGSLALPGFGIFITIVFLAELIFEYLYHKQYGTNYPVLNLYTKVCLAYYYFCFYLVYRKKSWASYLLLFYIVYLLLILIRNIFFISLLKLDTIAYIIGILLLFPIIFKYLYEVIYIRPYYNVLNDPWIYLSFGILIFFSCAFPMLFFADSLITYNPKNKAYIILLDIGNIVLSLSYLGISLCSRNQKTFIT